MNIDETEQERLAREYGLHVTSVGDILNDMSEGEPSPSERPPEGPFSLPRLPESPLFPAAGIYFDMPEDDYHAIPALSTTGIKRYAASSMLYWATCAWMNPEFAEYRAEQEAKKKENDHFEVGHAYHARILEGREAFEARFAVSLDRKDYPNALGTLDDIKAAYPEGVQPKGKNKREVFNRLREFDATVELWDDLREAHAKANEGRTMISAKTWRQLEIAAAMIERDPELGKAIAGGYPEVSLFWLCPKTGVPMKARADYLKLKAIVDLKSVAGREASMFNIVRMAIANMRYGIQPVVYFEGTRIIREMVRQGAAAVHGNEEQIAWTQKWAAVREPDQFLWIFQQKGVAPVARGVFWPRGGSTHTIIDGLVTEAKRRFRQSAETYGLDPWLDIAPIYDLADEDLPPYATEI